MTKLSLNQNIVQTFRSQSAAVNMTQKGKRMDGAMAAGEVVLTAADRHMELLYKSAIEKLNEALEADFGPDAIQNSAGIDVSPEATAERIVSLSTGFFDAFRRQNSELGDDEALEQFMETIGRGIEQGFEEAKEVLAGLQVLEGEIAGNIERTFDLVQDGLEAFKQLMKDEG